MLTPPRDGQLPEHVIWPPAETAWHEGCVWGCCSVPAAAAAAVDTAADAAATRMAAMIISARRKLTHATRYLQKPRARGVHSRAGGRARSLSACMIATLTITNT